MNKSMMLVSLIALGSLKVTAGEANTGAGTFLNKIKSGASQTPSYLKKAGGYLLSTAGAKDLALAYGVGMGLTGIHELGHAVTGRALCGTPISLVLGATPYNSRSYLKVGGVTLGGFNPDTGYVTNEYHGDKPLKEAAIYAAGPICGALSSLAVLLLLRNTDGLYMTKAAAAYGLFKHTLGIAGIGGTWTRGTDANRFVQSLRNYRASKKKK